MKDFLRLIVDAHTRPTPKALLEHRWVVAVMQQDINMARWIREVWGWPKPRKPKDS
jgi:mitogen-activated protein kinase kinase